MTPRQLAAQRRRLIKGYAEALAYELCQIDVTKADFARSVGITERHLYRLLTGASNPSFTTAMLIASELGVPITDFFRT